MKKFFSFAMLSAIALAGAVFTSCQSDEDVASVNPTYDGEAVKTTFSISLPGNLSTTRMASATVQLDENIASFRGMQDIVIIPFSHATSRTSRLGTNITLGENKMLIPTTTNAQNGIPNGQLLADSKAVLFNDVTIPVGTSGFLFYGKATGTDGFAEGYLTSEGLTGESSAIFFNPTVIQSTPVTTVGTALADYVSAIAAAKDGTDATITWAACANTANSAQTWYSAALGDLYTSFTSLTPGASAYVQAAVQDLYTTIKNNTDKVSVAIKAAILTKATDSGTGTLSFDSSLGTVDATHRGYPYDDNNSMPEGCATLSWSSATPKVASVVTSSTFGGGMTYTQAMNKVVYPASLYYFVDSSVKTSIASRSTEYVAGRTWTQILDTYTTGTSVASTTRSVAITKPIQYAVGRLDVLVNKLGTDPYYDRRGDVVTIPTDGFLLTGVLIGGQKKVDYKFEQVTSATEYAIYDKTINTTSASAYVSRTVDGGKNYTLALETAADQKVYVVLEFLNNSGKDFMGVDGVVKNNCKFYMIAQLDPASTNTNATGQSNTGNKVFKQDYKTIANFTFAKGTQDLNTNGTTDGHPDGVADTPAGFANAYVTIPDLRTPQLELGFSVDLHWEEGITFNYTF